MDHPRRIALLLDRSLSFVRGMLQGIRAFAADHPDWIVRDGPPRLNMVDRVRKWKPHGIIAGLVLPTVADALTQMCVPLVDTAFALRDLRVPRVDVDHDAVGRMAAQHFLDRRFTNFGYYGSPSLCYSEIQEQGFRRCLAEAGFSASSCHSDFLPDEPTALWRKSAQRTVRWLRQLPKPVAVFACEDLPARYLADVCRQLELRIPDDVALLGVGNDELECRLTQPMLSSIDVPSQQIGFEAARLLDRLMAGRAAPSQHLLVPPLRTVARTSTDTTAIEDEDVRSALQYIREHIRKPIHVAGLADALAVGRRNLERRFRNLLGRSVLEEIHRTRTEIAADLLADTLLPIAAIAQHAGFTSVRHMDVTFSRLKGMPPTAFRRQVQAYRHPDAKSPLPPIAGQ